MALVGMVGYAQAGKDTFARFMGWRRMAFADKLKQVALECNPRFVSPMGLSQPLATIVSLYGWEYAKKVPGVREFLQNLGLAIRDHVNYSAWVDATMRDLDPNVNTVITDVRFPNEVKAVRDRGGFIVRIQREGHGPVNGHVSEQLQVDPDFDFLFDEGDFAHMEEVAVDLRHRLA